MNYINSKVNGRFNLIANQLSRNSEETAVFHNKIGKVKITPVTPEDFEKWRSEVMMKYDSLFMNSVKEIPSIVTEEEILNIMFS